MKFFETLVVEDCRDFRRYVCSTLRQKAGCRVSEASDGLEALRKAEALQPNLILTDIGLPNINGIEVSRCARKLAPSAKILFVSQESSPDVVREALSTGAQGYVQKLFAQSELLPAIAAVRKGKCFVSPGLLEGSAANGHQWPEPEFLWQKTVMDAFQSASDSLAIKINIAEKAIAVRLGEHTDVRELLALRCALRSLADLIAETRPQFEASDEKKLA